MLRTWSGRTVEVANTDAEGRLVLADAVAYAVQELAPDVLVDVATLTGAASVGLGRGHGALFATDEEVADALEHAALATGERVWRMPLVEDYAGALRSDVADLRHVPVESPGGGAITAALFLREFVGDVPWAHLDVAGPRARRRTATRSWPGRRASAPGCCSRRSTGSDAPGQRRTASRRPSPLGSSAGSTRSSDRSDRPTSRTIVVTSSRRAGSATRSWDSAPSTASTPPGRRRRSPCSTYSG